MSQEKLVAYFVTFLILLTTLDAISNASYARFANVAFWYIITNVKYTIYSHFQISYGI